MITQTIRTLWQSYTTLHEVGQNVNCDALNDECDRKIKMWQSIMLILNNPYQYKVTKLDSTNSMNDSNINTNVMSDTTEAIIINNDIDTDDVYDFTPSLDIPLTDSDDISDFTPSLDIPLTDSDDISDSTPSLDIPVTDNESDLSIGQV